MTMNTPGYEALAEVLQAAYDQAAKGKGAERHANDLPFHEQPMQQIARRRGLGFLLGQADKKTEEAQGMLERGERDAWRREIRGAINYLAGALVFTSEPDYGADPAYFAEARKAWERPGPSVPIEPSESDSPSWFGREERPARDRYVEFDCGERGTERFWPYRGEWPVGVKRWRYVD